MKTTQSARKIQRLLASSILALVCSLAFVPSTNAQGFDFWDPWHFRNEAYDHWDVFYEARAASFQSEQWIHYAAGGPSFPSQNWRAERAYRYAYDAFYWSYFAYYDVNPFDYDQTLNPYASAYAWRLASNNANLAYDWLVSHMEVNQDFRWQAVYAMERAWITKEKLNMAAEVAYWYYLLDYDYQYPW